MRERPVLQIGDDLFDDGVTAVVGLGVEHRQGESVNTACARQWNSFLEAHVPVLDPRTGKSLTGRSRSGADRKRDILSRLYRHDQRVAPWAGTAHGVLQAVNTYEHHEGTIRGMSRAERNMLRTVTGDFSRLDSQSWALLQPILQST